MGGVAAALFVLAAAGVWLATSGGSPDDNGRGASARKDQPPKTEPKNVPPPVRKDTATPAPVPVRAPYEPLEKARKLRQDKPADYLALLEVFTAAEQGAPQDVLPVIRREKNEIEQQLFTAFRVKLAEQKKKVLEKMEAKDFPAALACLEEDKFPEELRADITLRDLARERNDAEQQTWLEFHRSVEVPLMEQLEQAGSVPAKLKEVREKLKGLPEKYPVKSVKDWVEKADALVETRLGQAAAAEAQAQEDNFRSALDKAMQAAAAAGPAPLAKAAETLADQKEFLSERFRERAELFRQDLLTAQTVYDKACAALNAKADAKESVKLRYPQGQTNTYKLTGKISQSKDGPGIWIQGDTGPGGSVFFSKLGEQDLIEQAGLTNAVPEGRHALGVFFFWRGRQEKAYVELLALKEDAKWGPRVAPYLAWMDERAASLIAQVQSLYVQCEGGKLSRLEKERRRRQASELLERLKRDFSATEVYNVRTQKAK
jgi:hypothetical protein